MVTVLPVAAPAKGVKMRDPAAIELATNRLTKRRWLNFTQRL